MSDATETTSEAPETETTEAATEKVKREKREMPTRVFQLVPGKLFKLLPETFPGITEAERWIDKNGADNATYWAMKGPAKPVTISPRRVTEADI